MRGFLHAQEARSIFLRLLKVISFPFLSNLKKAEVGASPVVQWVRIYLAMQGTPVQSLVQEDSTCHRTAKPVHRNCCRPSALKPVLHNKRSHCHEKPATATRE